jgi:type I restriction enzyme S subunit
MSEIKDIPKHWQRKKLGEVCNVLDNLRKPINSTERQQRIAGKSQDELYPYFGATGQVGWIDNFLTDGEFILIGEDGAPFLDIYKDKAYKIKGKTWVNNHAHILKGKNEFLLDDFALYYLNSINYREFVNGTTRLKLTKSNLVEIPFVVPPLPEQQAIVAKIEELLSELENGKQQLLTAQQQLKVYRQSLLKWAFEGKLTNKNVKEGELPKGWKFEELKNVCVIKRGKSKHRPRNEPALFGGKYPFIQTGDIREVNGGYIKKYSQTYSELGLQQSKLWPKGTLCITIAANIGETAILDFDACFPDSVVGLLSDEKLLLNKYTNYFFISHKSKLEKLAPATAQKNINVDILEKVKIPLPSIDEQQFIVSELESKLTVCDKIEETISQSLQQAETLRQSILKQAFEGQLVNTEILATI